jgi:hypothetical protein
MTSFSTKVAGLDWAGIAAQLDIEGYAIVPGMFDAEAARELARASEALSTGHRVSLSSTDLGRGDLIYPGASLPAPLGVLRKAFYGPLAVIANRWNETLAVGDRYPAELDEFHQRNRAAGQTQSQTYLSRLGVEDYVSLHQCNDGELIFPMQIVALLSEPGADFRGGEFVMTEQRPRMQSRPVVIPLKLGDAAIIATSVRPFKGAKGFYRVNLKHAISRVHAGERVGLELTFHDAA